MGLKVTMALTIGKHAYFLDPRGDGKRGGWVGVYIYRRRFLFEI